MNTTIIELTISMVTALLGLSYPLFIDLINKINDKYNSRRLSNKFRNELVYKLFHLLMVICIVELFTFPFIISYTKDTILETYFIFIQSISVFILSMCMVCMYNKTLTYLDPIRLIDYIRTIESPRNQFEDIMEIVENTSEDTSNTELYNICVSELMQHIMNYQQS